MQHIEDVNIDMTGIIVYGKIYCTLLQLVYFAKIKKKKNKDIIFLNTSTASAEQVFQCTYYISFLISAEQKCPLII